MRPICNGMRPICNGMRPICNGMRPIDVIREAKDIYMSGRVSGMCESFDWVIGGDWRLYLKNNIPLFCYNVAVLFGATGHSENYWWDKRDRDARIRCFDWLIERYRDPVWGGYYPVWGGYYPVCGEYYPV